VHALGNRVGIDAGVHTDHDLDPDAPIGALQASGRVRVDGRIDAVGFEDARLATGTVARAGLEDRLQTHGVAVAGHLAPHGVGTISTGGVDLAVHDVGRTVYFLTVMSAMSGMTLSCDLQVLGEDPPSPFREKIHQHSDRLRGPVESRYLIC